MAGVVLAGGALALVVANDHARGEPTVRETTTARLTVARVGVVRPGCGDWRVAVAAHTAGPACGDPRRAARAAHGQRSRASRATVGVIWCCSASRSLSWLQAGSRSSGRPTAPSIPAAPYGDRIPLESRTDRQRPAGADDRPGIRTDPQRTGPPLVAGRSVVGLQTAAARLGVELLLLVGPYAIASSAFPMWWAGSSSPARFLVPIVFPLGVAVASAWAHQSGRGRAISLTLLGASVMIATAFAFGGDGRLAYNASTGRARWLDWAAPLVDLSTRLSELLSRRAGALTPATP